MTDRSRLLSCRYDSPTSSSPRVHRCRLEGTRSQQPATHAPEATAQQIACEGRAHMHACMQRPLAPSLLLPLTCLTVGSLASSSVTCTVCTDTHPQQ